MGTKAKTTRRLVTFMVLYGGSALLLFWLVYLGIQWGQDYVGR